MKESLLTIQYNPGPFPQLKPISILLGVSVRLGSHKCYVNRKECFGVVHVHSRSLVRKEMHVEKDVSILKVMG